MDWGGRAGDLQAGGFGQAVDHRSGRALYRHEELGVAVFQKAYLGGDKYRASERLRRGI
jgi:hypothetical protein